jgi:hypothetical protein
LYYKHHKSKYHLRFNYRGWSFVPCLWFVVFCTFSGSVPTDLSHPGWNHDKLVEQGEKSGLGAIAYMDTLEENCFENATLHLRESCNDSRAARA